MEALGESHKGNVRMITEKERQHTRSFKGIMRGYSVGIMVDSVQRKSPALFRQHYARHVAMKPSTNDKNLYNTKILDK